MTTETGRIRCQGSVIHLGRAVATVEGRIVDADGRLVAHPTSTCLLMRPGERGSAR